MSAIQELLSAWLKIKHDGVGIGAVIMHNEAAAELAKLKYDVTDYEEIIRERDARVEELETQQAALEAERDEWKKRAEQAAHIGEDDKVGFDLKVLEQIEFLEEVRELLQEAVDTHFLEMGFAVRCRNALDALKGAE